MRKYTISFCLIFMLLAIGTKTDFAQNQTQERSSYTIYTHTILGSNKSGTGNTKLPNEISNAISKLNNIYNYTNYRKLSTHFQIIESKGSFTQKGIISDLELSKDDVNPSFASWVYSGLEEKNDLGQENMIGFRGFTFDLSLPVNFTRYTDYKGNPAEGVKYQSISLSLQSVVVPLNKPTVFATLPISANDETLFFVMKIMRNK